MPTLSVVAFGLAAPALTGLCKFIGSKEGDTLLGFLTNFGSDAAKLLPGWIQESIVRKIGEPNHRLSAAFHQALDHTLKYAAAGSPIKAFRNAHGSAWNSLHTPLRQAIETWFKDLAAAKKRPVSGTAPLIPLDDAFLKALLEETDLSAPSHGKMLEELRADLEKRLLYYTPHPDQESEAAARVFIDWLLGHLDSQFQIFFLEQLQPSKDGKPSGAWTSYQYLVEQTLQENDKAILTQGKATQEKLDALIALLSQVRTTGIDPIPELPTLLQRQVQDQQATDLDQFAGHLVEIHRLFQEIQESVTAHRSESRIAHRETQSGQESLRRWIVPLAATVVLGIPTVLYVQRRGQSESSNDQLNASRKLDQAAVQDARIETKQDVVSSQVAAVAEDMRKLRIQLAAQGKKLEEFTEDQIVAQLAILRRQPLADIRKIIEQGLQSKLLTDQANALRASGRLVEAEAKSLEAVRQRTAQIDSEIEATAMDYNGAGDACYLRGDYRAALSHYSEALNLAAKSRFPLTWALLQNGLGLASQELGLVVHPEEGNRLIREAVIAHRAALDVYTREALPQDWAMTQNNLGTALWQQGRREGDKRLIGDAVTAYRAALDVYTREALPQQWAMTQNNVGIALSDKSDREEGAAATRLLGQAVTAYRTALEVISREAMPKQWALIQHNLAISLQKKGVSEEGLEVLRLLREAVTACRAALEVYTREAMPLEWAGTQNDLGTALIDLGLRFDGGGEGTLLMKEAVTAFRAALEVYTREALPPQWAATQNNLGNALSNQGLRAEGGEGIPLLKEAVAAYRAALNVYTREALPQQWAMTQDNLGTALWNQGVREEEDEEGMRSLREAVTAYRAALEVYTREATPQDWAKTQNNLGNALRNKGVLAAEGPGTRFLTEAVAAYRAALNVYTREALPQQWAMTQDNLGTALNDQGGREDGEKGTRLLDEAVTAYRAALEVSTREALPQDWAKTQNNLGNALANQGDREEGEAQRKLWQAAEQAYLMALEVWTEQAMPFGHQQAMFNLQLLREQLKQ